MMFLRLLSLYSFCFRHEAYSPASASMTQPFGFPFFAMAATASTKLVKSRPLGPTVIRVVPTSTVCAA